jgi:hypothetical protein
MERPQGGVLDDWLASLQPITQHLLLAMYLADGQPQPAKDVADVLPQLQDVVEEQGAWWGKRNNRPSVFLRLRHSS